MTTQEETDLATGLKVCSACGISISSYVNKCPGCGQHTQRGHAQHVRKQHAWQFGLMMLAAIAVFGILIALVMNAE